MRLEASAVALAAAAIAMHESNAYAYVNPGVRAFRPNAGRRKRRARPPHPDHARSHRRRRSDRPLFSDPDDEDAPYDPNRWISADSQSSLGDASWEKSLAGGDESLGSFSAFPDDGGGAPLAGEGEGRAADADGGEEAWLDAIASIAAGEVEFMSREADRADKARQMQELGFGAESIASTLGVATDGALEADGTNEVLEAFKEQTARTGFGLMVADDLDLQTVESHTQVEWDDESDEPVRAQHVYVDEVTCIGCTNCATIAQSTFFMEDEHGRARVFQQWGDDDETIQVAIETCPVDCIHYVPYDELKRLEIERRGQNINFKARLVNQGEFRSGAGFQSARYGGGALFTDQQAISGNMGSRCNNCPSRGCETCPMYGVGLNPEFQRRETKRKERLARAEMRRKMESQKKRAEL